MYRYLFSNNVNKRIIQNYFKSVLSHSFHPIPSYAELEALEAALELEAELEAELEDAAYDELFYSQIYMNSNVDDFEYNVTDIVTENNTNNIIVEFDEIYHPLDITMEEENPNITEEEVKEENPNIKEEEK
jgi:hypothetical protein